MMGLIFTNRALKWLITAKFLEIAISIILTQKWIISSICLKILQKGAYMSQNETNCSKYWKNVIPFVKR